MNRPEMSMPAAQNLEFLRRGVIRAHRFLIRVVHTPLRSRPALPTVPGLLLAIGLSAAAPPPAHSAEPSDSSTLSATIQAPADSLPSGAVIVSGWSADELRRFRDWPPRDARWSELVDIRVIPEPVDSADAWGAALEEIPRVAGEFHAVADSVQFQPRYPLSRGVRYRVQAHSDADPQPQSLRIIVSLPKTPPLVATAVTRISPVLDVVPENLLRIYIHFSAPMSRGDAYRYVKLLDEQGQTVEHPFLELGEELWDPEQRRFTLYFDPGRIKRGLQPNELFGTPLRAGRRFTLVIDRSWPDATGYPLAETVRRTFRVVESDRTQPDFAAWQLVLPPAGSQKPLQVEFTEPLDRALLQRMLWIESDGSRLEGRIAVSKEQTVWSFSPTSAWRAGRYELVADGLLEDRAGNSLGRPFEVPEGADSGEPAEFRRTFTLQRAASANP